MSLIFRSDSVLSDIDDHTYSATTPKIYLEDADGSTVDSQGNTIISYDGKTFLRLKLVNMFTVKHYRSAVFV